MSGITVNGLAVEIAESSMEIVHDVSFSVAPVEVLGIVGESGCGKTTVALAVLGGTRAGARITAGEVTVAGRAMLGLSDSELQLRRGKDVAYVPQDPSVALNPSLRIERQLSEMIQVHTPELARKAALQQTRETLADVSLPSDPEFLRRYPHQLSGGQQQRVAIAMAALLRPKAIVMDEPTTGLDVTTQARILQTVRDLCQKHRVAIVYVSHDLAVVGQLAHRVLVIYAGRVIEFGPTGVLRRPVHPYTRGLVGAIPVVSQARVLATSPGHPPRPGAEYVGCRFAERCSFRTADCDASEPALTKIESNHEARCIRGRELRDRSLASSMAKLDDGPSSSSSPLLEVRGLSAAYGREQVLENVSLSLGPRECVALVGESGSGKTTLGRCIIGLHAEWQGEVTYCGEPMEHVARKRSLQLRQDLQYIFQSPYNALNPRRTIAESVAAPLSVFADVGKRERYAKIRSALEQVSLSSQLAQRYPDQLSGGERQRVAIARALICEPRVMICDEITSALDVSVQAAIVGLLADLRAERDLAMIFVTHNLALVRSIADRVLVLNAGRIVESGRTGSVLDTPVNDYTRGLLADTPTLDHETELMPSG